MAEVTGFGYPIAALMFVGLIGLTAIAYFVFKIDEVLAFWIAYILTRPLGASTGDLLSQPIANGGLGLGTTLTSVAFLTVIVGLVFYLTKHPEVESVARETRRKRHRGTTSVVTRG